MSTKRAAIYLDHNSSGIASPAVIAAMTAWMNKGNPSAEHASAKEARAMIDAFRKDIAVECAFTLDKYAVIFTSGGSESNATIITSTVRSYTAKTGKLPHVITSAAEHKSTLLCCLRLAKEKYCQITILPVASHGADFGTVSAEDLERAMRLNTCLVTIMAANNETGILSNLRDLTRITKAAKVPFHTDAVQLFGRSPVRPVILGVDAFSASCHKFGGPPGVGVLVVRRALIEGYDLCAHIPGAQNAGMRGGTENTPGIAASAVAFKAAMINRSDKNALIARLRDAIKTAIASRLPCFNVMDHPEDQQPSIDGGITAAPVPREGTAAAIKAIDAAEDKGHPAIFWIAPKDTLRVLPNTLLIAVRRPGFCNRAARSALEKRGVIVSLGAACSSADAETSSVVAAMAIPAVLHKGVLRISLGDDTTLDDAKAFVRNFFAVVTSDECLS